MPIPSQPTTNISLGPTLSPTNRSISAEFSDDAPHAMSEFYRGGARVPTNPLNAGVPESGAITFSQFNGATSAPAIIPITYTLSSVQNLNLLDYATSPARPAPTRYTAGASGYSIEFQIPSPTVIGSATRTQNALVTGASGPTGWHPDVPILIVNAGVVIGAGGVGGAGGFAVGAATPPAPPAINGVAGLSGGTALVAQRAVTIQNTGTFAGGGGAGGGGGGVGTFPTTFKGIPTPGTAWGGGGGGGGAGQALGLGGAGGGFPSPLAGTPGQNAPSNSAGGAGGAGNTPSPLGTTGAGGAGAGRGATGTAGQAAQPTIPAGQRGTGGAGGANGFYAIGATNITWQATGTRQGQVQPTV